MRPPARTFPRSPAAAAAGRTWLTGVLQHRVPDLEAETHDAVLLALCEAITNAVQHGRGHFLHVRCWINTGYRRNQLTCKDSGIPGDPFPL